MFFVGFLYYLDIATSTGGAIGDETTRVDETNGFA